MKTSFTNTAVALVASLFLFSCSKESAIESLVEPVTAVSSLNTTSNNVTNAEDFNISERAFIACANNGAGEWCTITGKGRYLETSNGNKPPRIVISKLAAVGEDSGDHFSDFQNKVYNLSADKQFNIRLNSNAGQSVEIKIQVGNLTDSDSKGSVVMVKSTC